MSEVKAIPVREEMIVREGESSRPEPAGDASAPKDAFIAAADAAMARTETARAAEDKTKPDLSQMSWSTRRRTDTSWESCLEIDGQKFYVDLMSRKEVAQYLARVSELRDLAAQSGDGAGSEGLKALDSLDDYVDANTAVLQKRIKMWSLPFPCNADEIADLTMEATQKVFMALFLKSKSGLSALPF